MWKVLLVKPTIGYIFRNDYFPRVFHYKRDAMELVREVAGYGGRAVIERATEQKKVA